MYIYIHIPSCSSLHIFHICIWNEKCVCIDVVQICSCIHANRLICINHQRGNWDMDPETFAIVPLVILASRKLVFYYNHHDPESSNRIGTDTIYIKVKNDN